MCVCVCVCVCVCLVDLSHSSSNHGLIHTLCEFPEIVYKEWAQYYLAFTSFKQNYICIVKSRAIDKLYRISNHINFDPYS